jgi:hypothetical protein
VDINIDYCSEKKYPCGVPVLGVKVMMDCLIAGEVLSSKF